MSGESVREQAVELVWNAISYEDLISIQDVGNLVDAIFALCENVAEPGCAYHVSPQMKRLADEHARLQEAAAKLMASATRDLHNRRWALVYSADVDRLRAALDRQPDQENSRG